MLTLAHLTHVDMAMLDTAASSTVSVLQSAVSSVIAHIYPFLSWLHTAFIVLGECVISIIIVIAIIKSRAYLNQKQQKSNIKNFLTTLETNTVSDQINEQNKQI